MSDINFSSLQQSTTASNTEQFLMRLDNALSGADGFARISKLNVEKSLGVYSTVQSESANWDSTYTTVLSTSASWGGGGGLTIFREVSSVTTPNNTTPVYALSASSVSSDVDAALIAKGNGATLAQIPDNTSSGGSKRGQYATDLQKQRSAASKVASGSFSTIAGGRNNTASGGDSVAIGENNAATGGASFAVGSGNTASGANSVAVGGYNDATGIAAVAVGYTNSSSGSYSTVAGGQLNQSNGTFSTVPGGYGANASKYGQYAYASHYWSDAGDSQHFQYVLCADAGNGSQPVLDPYNGQLSITDPNTFSLLPPSVTRAVVMNIQVVGICSDGSVSHAVRKVVIKKLDTNSYNEEIVDIQTIGTDRTDAGTPTFTINAFATPQVFVVAGDSPVNQNTRWIAHVSGVMLVQPPAYG